MRHIIGVYIVYVYLGYGMHRIFSTFKLQNTIDTQAGLLNHLTTQP